MSPEREVVVCRVPFETDVEGVALKRLKEIGVTSIQIYTFWNQFEPEARGDFDWRFYDRRVRLIGEAGLKYVPFILMGPRYAAPDWWLASEQHAGLYCLEHGKYNPIESIWNPHFREEISRVLEAFAAHYLPMDVLESVQPGICGDYGEAIMPVHGNWPGFYHTHAGYWCGGEDARADFRRWLLEKYGDVETLNRAWRSAYTALDTVAPFLPHRTPSRTAFFDMIAWYRHAMTQYAEFWMAECRRLFPHLPAYLCTGGVEQPTQASLFSDQARIAARHGGGIRLTNENNKFYDNFYLTAYTKSACDFYGAYLGLEPVGPMTDNGVVARIFGSAAYGNRQIFHYYNNLFHDDATPRPAAAAVKQYLDLIGRREHPRSVALFWPGCYTAWHGGMPNDLKAALTFVRRMTACLPVNEEMIRDGALARADLLVMPVAPFTEREILLRIAEWVRAGGVLLASGVTRDLELEPVPEYDELFGILPNSEQAAGICRQVIATHPDLPRWSALDSYTANTSWMDLAPDVAVLSATEEGPGYGGTITRRTSSAFLRRVKQGLAILYEGPMTFEQDPEALFHDPGAYPSLLADVVLKYGRTAPLTPMAGEIARAEVDGVCYALKMGEIVPGADT